MCPVFHSMHTRMPVRIYGYRYEYGFWGIWGCGYGCGCACRNEISLWICRPASLSRAAKQRSAAHTAKDMHTYSRKHCTQGYANAFIWAVAIGVVVASFAVAAAASAAAAVALGLTVCCWHCCCGRIESIRQIGNNNAHVSKIEFKYTYKGGGYKSF